MIPQSDCERCSGHGLVVARQGEVAIATACSCLHTCKTCRDTGWVSTKDSRFAPQKRCDCTKLSRKKTSFNAARIPGRHAASTRTSFHPTSAKQTAALMGVSGWLKHYKPGEENRGLVLYGDVGRGKTHLMTAILRDLVFEHGVSVRFIEFSHLLSDIKSSFDVGRGQSALIDPLVTVDVLAIDELGKGRNTEFEGTVLDELISRRYNAAATVIATTNYAPERSTGRGVANSAAVAMGASGVPTLPDRVGDRVYSRLREMCDFVEVIGQDWREKRGR